MNEADLDSNKRAGREPTSLRADREVATDLGREIRGSFGHSRLRLRGDIGGEDRRAPVSRSLRRALQLDAGSAP